MSEKENVVAASAERGDRKTLRGYVVSDKMQKTIVVDVEDRVKHALYGKVMRRNKNVKAHDENNEAGIGDLVVIAETRPLSADKRWRLVEIVGSHKVSCLRFMVPTQRIEIRAENCHCSILPLSYGGMHNLYKETI